MEEAQIVEDVEAPPVSESMQRNINRGKANEACLSEILEPMQLEASPMSEAQIVVDLEASLQRELDTLWGNANEAENFTIFRTPHNISKRKKNLFQPSVISIGPFHRGQKHLRAMEEQKKRFLRDFLSRGDHISLNLCISGMKSLEEKTRRCYSEKFDDLKSKAFVEMMLLDGCFVLEYILKCYERNVDSIFEVGWNHNFIDSDLLLLENQIPFFIVEKLYEIGNLNQKVERMNFVKFTAYIFLFRILTLDDLNSLNSINSIDSIPDPPVEIHHFVHLCYHYLVPHPEKPNVFKSFNLTIVTKMFCANRIIKGLFHRFRSRVLRVRSPYSTSRSLSMALPKSTVNMSSMVIPSATELKQKGLKFTPKSKPKHMLDISFEYGVMKIPRLTITDDTKSIFANLLAFEQSKYGKENRPFTRFVAFLDNLINTPNDVIILQECGIVENWLGSEEELAHFFNQVGEGAIFERGHYLAELYTDVNRYCESSWNKQRARFIRDYFSSPWAAISLIAALILLVLTFVQSFYAVYAYKFPPSS